MSRPLDIVVIADDMTGGADTGVQFCPAVGPVYLTSGVRPEIASGAPDLHGVALYTNSRHTDLETARQRVRRAYANISRLSPKQVYKKIDSCLRGNVGAEVDVLLQATGASMSFVAPALPGQGRTTENDIHLVNGIPVADTEIGRDLRSPVKESRLSVFLQKQSRMVVGRVEMAVVEAGVSAMADRVLDLADNGCRHIVFDAASDRHLDRITALAKHRLNNQTILLVGSAGLATSLNRLMSDTTKQGEAARPGVKKWLFVCGSAATIISRQIAALLDHTSWPHLCMDIDRLVEGNTAAAPDSSRNIPEGGRSVSGLVLSIVPPGERKKAAVDPERILRGFSEAAAEIIAGNRPQGLFLSGGDTAEAVLESIGATGVELHEEIIPGLVYGRITGGICHRLPVVTKAGTFGSENALVQLIKLF